MKTSSFVDSNIWLYAFMDSSGDIKRQAALKVISADGCNLNTQVINEVSINLLKKADYSNDDIIRFVENMYATYSVSVLDKSVIIKSAQIRQKYNLSYWDSLIVASALENGCKILYTEDMQHGQIIENKLKIINPFKSGSVYP